MGCYNSVQFSCPGCGSIIEAQSKAGDCSMRDFSPRAVPPAEAADLDGDVIRCTNCENHYEIGSRLPRHVELFLK